MELIYDESKLLEPLIYLTKIPGKKIRTKLIQSFNYWLGIPHEKLIKITEIIEMLHNSSLLIDDIEDSSSLRRGVPSAHTVYGIPLTINTANYAYFICLSKAIQLDAYQAANIYSEQLLDLHKGQGMEIWFRDNFVCPNEVQYKELVLKKTGGLFKLAIRLMQIFSADKSNKYDPLIDSIGLFFQIRDDYANLVSKEYADSKSFCEDLTEGKFSFPVIHSMNANPSDNRLLDILKRRTYDLEEKKLAIKILEESNSLNYTLDYLKKLKQNIFDEMKTLGENELLEKLLSQLCKIIDG